MPVPPSPPASSDATRAVMRGNRGRDTGPERALRTLLHAMGLRYRVDLPIRVDASRPIRADIAFTGPRVAVFVDGCFWHSCPQHRAAPRSNAGWWKLKLAATVDRDRRDEARLARTGWVVVRVWEHEDPRLAAQRVAALVGAVKGSRR